MALKDQGASETEWREAYRRTAFGLSCDHQQHMAAIRMRFCHPFAGAGRRLNSPHRLTIYPARSIRILICSPPGSSNASKPWLIARSRVIFFVTIFLAGRRPELIRRMRSDRKSCAAPAARAAKRVNWPMGPAPVIKTLLPAVLQLYR